MTTNAPVPGPELHDACILIVDDQEANVVLLARILSRAGFTRVLTTTESRDVARLYAQAKPDLILLDLRMPELDGFAVLAQLRELQSPTDFLPVLAITGDASSETRRRVLGAGAKDFLEKPFETSEVIVRVENLLTTRLLHRSLREQNGLLELKVRERTAQLETALAAAESASRAKSQFLATMSHELRTPLNAVIGFSRHLSKNKAGNLQSQDLEYLDRIGHNGTHLLRIINDILDLSRVEAGKVLVEVAPVALHKMVAETCCQVATARIVAGKNVALTNTVSASLNSIITDEAKFRRILINLIDNAVKFTAKGSIRISAESDDRGRPQRVDVVDTGIGIPAERLAAIFDRFEQVDNSTQRKFGGTGLGLAISKTLCELLGYRLSVVSEPGVGSGFSILLAPSANAPETYAELAEATEQVAAVAV